MIDAYNLTKKIDELIFYLDDVAGNKLYREIKKHRKELIELNPENAGAFLALQFLIIPFLYIEEVCDLFKDHLYAGLQIDEIDLSERIKKYLLFLDLEDRNDHRNKMKNSILLNKEKITEVVLNEDKKEISTVKDWLIDYLDQDVAANTSLAKAKYIGQKSYVIQLDQFEKNLIKKLINLYQYLNLSSLTPEGFEDDVLLREEDGKMVSTNKGERVVLYDPRNKKRHTEDSSKIRTAFGPPKTQAERAIEKIEVEKQALPEQSLERAALDEEVEKQKHLEDLQYQATKFAEDSLERMALDEEIARLKR